MSEASHTLSTQPYGRKLLCSRRCLVCRLKIEYSSFVSMTNHLHERHYVMVTCSETFLDTVIYLFLKSDQELFSHLRSTRTEMHSIHCWI